jgi:very-short-patch-repair endonuclease
VSRAEAMKKRRSSALEAQLALQIHAARLPMPEREVRFHPTRRWRFDFAWPELKIAVEAEGGTWVNGAHGRGKHFESDAEKYNAATLAGWRVFRFTTDMIADGRALAVLRQVFQNAN